MVERASPLGSDFRPGSYGDFANGAEVTILEIDRAGIVEATAWPGQEKALCEALAGACNLRLSAGSGNGAANREGVCAFNIGPGRFLVSGPRETLAGQLESAVPDTIGTVTDLSHGRTVLGIEGPKAEWVLAKLFALDFASAAFPVHSGCATAHHEIAVQIQRRGEKRFELYVSRSLARSFANTLRRAAEDVGYTIK
ncbi:sarcosine oxidase subunit gamma [Nitratireductor sp.]|uniref:sarcosine oxidase subunit gamma n=1 Tax=Nitratireductor sp. TaxID=1872084 RepID=UPI002603CEBE|nr:sarcosine oxidase subunit gamma family protein [Nitratireductor sp.]MCV0377616.1 sarcosine oxidase subunit gamma [Nitratireductor sp.]